MHLRAAPTRLAVASAARRVAIASTTLRRSATTDSSSSTSLQVTDPLDLYRGLVAQGKVQFDPEQVRALVQIRKVHAALLDYQPPIRLLTLLEALRPTNDPAASVVPEWPFKRSHLSSIGMDLLPSEQAERMEIVGMSEKARSKALVTVLKGSQGLEDLDTPRGFLLTGPPGTGKSLLMDIFFQSLPVPHKVRFHYHHFLLSIYSKVHDALELHRLEAEAEELAMNKASGLGEDGYPWSRREEMKALAITKGWRAVFAGGRSPNDPDLNTKEFVLATIARDLIKTHGWLLAFDEVQLVDIAGAGLINRVLSWYWRLGGVVVGTSNRVPEDLYNQGVQRDSVNGFLVALASRSPVIELRSALDYRREQRGVELDSESDRPAGDFGQVEAWKRWGSLAKGWYVRGEEAEFEAATKRLVGEEVGEKKVLKVYGRDLVVPWVVGGVARFSFHELCEKALGPADFITIGSNFHTLIITDVPVLLLNAKNEARRLITLLDSLYETKTRLLVSAEVGIDTLFFPDAVKGTSLSSPTFEPSPDDIFTSGGPNHPFSAERIYESDSLSMPSHSALRNAVDPAGEIGDSLTQEMMGDLAMDLEAPYRPNISSYDATSNATYSKDEARVDVPLPRTKTAPADDRQNPHPSASTPAFQSLAIFSGEEERFAFKRAVSRVHEMSSSEFLRTAEWAPLDPSMRTWERPSRTAAAPRPQQPSRDSMGAVLPLGEEKLSGVLPPSEMRLKYPGGMPKHSEVDVRTPKRGEKFDINQEDPRRTLPTPKLKSDHVWGVREDWGPGAGVWGKGASAFEGEAEVAKKGGQS